jgi:hypothetical protein
MHGHKKYAIHETGLHCGFGRQMKLFIDFIKRSLYRYILKY